MEYSFIVDYQLRGEILQCFLHVDANFQPKDINLRLKCFTHYCLKCNHHRKTFYTVCGIPSSHLARDFDCRGLYTKLTLIIQLFHLALCALKVTKKVSVLELLTPMRNTLLWGGSFRYFLQKACCSAVTDEHLAYSNAPKHFSCYASISGHSERYWNRAAICCTQCKHGKFALFSYITHIFYT